MTIFDQTVTKLMEANEQMYKELQRLRELNRSLEKRNKEIEEKIKQLEEEKKKKAGC